MATTRKKVIMVFIIILALVIRFIIPSLILDARSESEFFSWA
jgi:hypothetical protein